MPKKGKAKLSIGTPKLSQANINPMHQLYVLV